MGRPAATLLLDAFSRTSIPEDRTTEVLAYTLAADAGLLARMLEGAQVELGDRYVISTQQRAASGLRPDVVVWVYRGLAPTGVLWIECKTGARYGDEQLPDYADEVEDVHPGGKVLTIAPTGANFPGSSDGAERWTPITWQDVADQADARGQELAGVRLWRTVASLPDAPARVRNLLELVSHLEWRSLVVMEPLTALDVLVARRADDFILEVVPQLLSSAAAAMNYADPDGGPVSRRAWARLVTHWQLLRPKDPDGCWVSDERWGHAYGELLFAASDGWRGDSIDQPAFAAGYTFNAPSAAVRAALSDRSWQATLPGEVEVGEDGSSIVRVVKTMYLSELVAKGASFPEQAQALGEWADTALSETGGLAAPPLPSGP